MMQQTIDYLLLQPSPVPQTRQGRALGQVRAAAGEKGEIPQKDYNSEEKIFYSKAVGSTYE